MSSEACPACGSSKLKKTRPRRYQYRVSGLDNVYLVGGVTRFECADCGEGYVQIEAEHQLMELMALGLLLKPAMLSGREMRFLRKASQFTQDELARRLGITRRAVIEREKKATPSLKADQELGLRVVLAGGFKARLDRDGTHLSSKHLKQLDRILQRFADFAEELETKAKLGRTTLTRDKAQRSWRFTEPDALAA